MSGLRNRQQLEAFMRRVLAVEPQYIDVFGNNVPGMVGRSAATSGAAQSGTDVVNRLRAEAVAFARLYAHARASTEELQTAAKKLEAELVVAITLGVLPEAEAQSLIDELYNLVENR